VDSLSFITILILEEVFHEFSIETAFCIASFKKYDLKCFFGSLATTIFPYNNRKRYVYVYLLGTHTRTPFARLVTIDWEHIRFISLKYYVFN
jgi:hypothetical protein